MILKLHNGTVTVLNNNRTEFAKRAYISYEYEIGTNHLTPLLIINDIYQYRGDNVEVNLDLNSNEVSFTVYLYDKNNNIVRKYNSTYILYKMCVVGKKEYINIFDELERLRKENQELKEKGEVI